MATNQTDDHREREGLTLLGAKGVDYPSDYDPSVLERFSNRHPGNDYFVKFNCPEFTSLCPITGQPDFATITISYVPDEYLVESKSLKLYLFSYWWSQSPSSSTSSPTATTASSTRTA